jgi:NADH-quinone oxidoreductase subunit G
MIDGRGNKSQIDVFPGVPSTTSCRANVIDLCPVGALLDKDFLFTQRVWFLKSHAAIDGITASGDNIWVEHNEGKIYRIKPRTNMDVNKWWITDEVRYGWKFQPFDETEAPIAYEMAYDAAVTAMNDADHIGVLVSPMLSCEEAYLLALYASQHDANITFGIGPVPIDGEDKTFPDGFVMRAEKAPNARGVRRVLEAFGHTVCDYDQFVHALNGSAGISHLLLTGNYPSQWVTPDLLDAIGDKRFVCLVDTLENPLVQRADVVIPGATWAEKAGTFENVNHRLQAFERAIEPIDYCKCEAQIALDLIAAKNASTPAVYNAANIRQAMAGEHGLAVFVSDVHLPVAESVPDASDMEFVEL